jgi:hypothetical protein
MLSNQSEVTHRKVGLALGRVLANDYVQRNHEAPLVLATGIS